MRTFRLNKLVRDKIVEFNVGYGGLVKYKTLKGEELNNALVAKLIEEAKELLGAKLSAEELADIREIIDQLAKNLKISKEELKKLQTKKNVKNGAFKKGHFIEHLSLPNDHKWAKYYASNPDRFPEVQQDSLVVED
jgi:predicted house-cleaning noncanonical NTP pyrophosphatase (MazG superfamily)